MGARDDRVRAELEPLAPGERPTAVTVAVVVAVVVAVGNVVASDDLALGLGVAAVALALAFAMWRLQGWAVLVFMTALALTAISAGLGLLVASNLQALLLCVGLLAGSGTLFWFLIRPLARIQTPPR